MDTSVLSLLATGRLDPGCALATWLRKRVDVLYLSAVSVVEVEQSIAKLRRAGGTERADRLAIGWTPCLAMRLTVCYRSTIKLNG